VDLLDLLIQRHRRDEQFGALGGGSALFIQGRSTACPTVGANARAEPTTTAAATAT
jgi:hypothetical protein